MIVKLLMFTLIFAAMNSYVVARLFSLAPWGPAPKMYIVLAIAVLVLFEMAPFVMSRVTIDPGAEMPSLRQFMHVFYYVTYSVMGAFFCALFFTLAGDAVLLATRWFLNADTLAVLRKAVFWTIVAGTVFSTAVGLQYGARKPVLVQVDVPVRNLPAALDGYRIVQISDLHIGPILRRDYAAAAVKLANDADADLIALTGDLSDGVVPEMREHIEPLSQLKSRDGNYFILGNHEYYWNTDRWLALYKGYGFRILRNSHDIITRGGQKLAIAGVTDYSTRRTPSLPDVTSPDKAAAGIPKDAAYKILLAHQPSDYKRAAAAGFDLQLSGHTHGGQFFPWTIGFHLFHKYVYGLGSYENMQIFVTRGAGYWGPPLRGFAPSEVVLLVLKRVE